MISAVGEIGRMDRRITIQAPTQAQGGTYGEPTQSWAEWAVVWAKVTSTGGREFHDAAQLSAEITTRFQIRYKAGLVPTMRILFEGRIYHIHHVNELGRHWAWEIFAKAREI